MARESNAPTEPLTPAGKPNIQPRPAHIQEPEFGKPSPIGPSQRSNHLFNIPKANQSRAEHHRPAPRPQPHGQPQQRHQGHPSATPQSYRPSVSSGAPFATPSAKRSEPWDPFKPVAPSAYNNPRGGFPHGAVSIKRPENVTWTTPRAARPIYQSKPLPPKMTGASKNIQKFMDLTRDDTDPVPRASAYASEFGAVDMNGYVDTAMANENIKALLEGAFEEEEEKPKTKRKGKKKGGKKKSKKTSSKETKDTKKEEAIDDLDDLAAQLQSVTVDDSKDTDASEQKPSAKGEDVDKVTQQGDEDDDAAQEDEEEEDEDDDDDDEDDGVVEGLKVTLLPHQIEGVRWMCDKETGRKTTKGIFPKGGILADDMGLGKTVQAIALLLKNPMSDHENSDNSDEKEGKTTQLPPNCIPSTLVIAPLALIKQWESEIKDKVEPSHKLRVCLYHGTTRAKTSTSLDKYDVVITTYGTLTSEFNSSASDKAKKAGIFAVHWYRIILDEAHTIKNRNAKATQSAYALDAQYRWCLTGTPLQNNLDELQSLIKFLRVKPYDDLAAWRDQITRPLNNGRGGLAIQRLQVYLKAFMKRRTKDVLRLNDENSGEEGSDGEPKKSSNGFQIKKREVIKVVPDFMPGELNFYKRLEQRTDNTLGKMMGGGKVDYAGALVLLLRLRQACNHPDLVKGDLAKDKDILLQNGSTNSQSTQSKPDDLDSIADLFGAMSVVAKKCDVCQTDLSQSEIKSGGSRCGECEADLNINVMGTDKKKKKKSKKSHRSVPDSPSARKSDAQIARSRKNRRVVLDSDDEDEEGEEGDWVVPEDQRKMPNLGKAGGLDDENAEGGGEWLNSEDETDDDTDDEIDSPSRRKSKPIILSDSEDESDSEAEDIYNDEGENGDLPSTKIRHLMRILNREAPDFKFIVFSVFTSMLDKIEPFLKRANIGFARYDGGMANNHREASLEKLRNHSGTRVLLCSLRAGALGLNLTAASRVVILEPFWNPFVEEQAIDRVHRLNQTIDVKIYKMVIKGTVEERIVALQDRKRELANATIEGKAGAGKLTVRDMMALFGRDAESRYTDTQNTLDFNQPTRLLNNDEPEPAPSSSRESTQSDPRSRGRESQHHRPRTEDSVYGRRW
ncbi:hypothetical protein N7457_007966 [Penicillium paradoxum]|uniref:uncharacterized protein n=1 Tax=Penicillium paradoxum TaxID=176176 RepID=UPI002547EF16|nr:uncharacterized protein N7457_007966 [Penicillium paradoxum]KAJ5773070.1 hypothetical protein N7457_007966 [Penicillium paradoxum]